MHVFWSVASWNPALHLHSYFPLVFIQICEQPPFRRRHSLISREKKFNLFPSNHCMFSFAWCIKERKISCKQWLCMEKLPLEFFSKEKTSCVWLRWYGIGYKNYMTYKEHLVRKLTQIHHSDCTSLMIHKYDSLPVQVPYIPAT